MKLGQIANYKVLRETNLGYILYDEEGEYFLHHNECNGQYFKEEDQVQAFLYFDKQKRVAATCFLPLITINKGNLCTVVNRTETGAFVNIGISRDILLSSDDFASDLMPQIGDKVCCRLKVKNNTLCVKVLNKEEILSLNDQTILNIKDKIVGYVYRITEHGINIVDEHFNIIFIYVKNLRKGYRIGEKVDCRITQIVENEYYGTTLEQKEIVMEEDKKTILNYLENHYGVIPFSENSDSDLIFRVFKMSKASFKRALGSLYKEKLIVIEDKRIILYNYLNK